MHIISQYILIPTSEEKIQIPNSITVMRNVILLRTLSERNLNNDVIGNKQQLDCKFQWGIYLPVIKSNSMPF